MLPIVNFSRASISLNHPPNIRYPLGDQEWQDRPVSKMDEKDTKKEGRKAAHVKGYAGRTATEMVVMTGSTARESGTGASRRYDRI